MRKLAHGTKLMMGDGESDEEFTSVVYLDTIGLPSSSRASVDMSDHDTEDAMEFLPAALMDGGAVAFGGHLDPMNPSQGLSAGAGVIAALESGIVANWRIVPPGAGAGWRVSFRGFVQARGGDANAESGTGKLRISGEIKVTGKPVFEAAA